MSRTASAAALVLLLLPACAPSRGVAPAAAPAAEPAPAVVAERPIPGPLVPPPEFQAAVARGTRTLEGDPGPRYWQNWTDYTIRTRLHTAEKRLEGSAQIVYHNRSPDALEVLVVDLAQNLHAPGVPRNEPAEVTGGVEIRRVAVGGEAAREAAPGVQGARYEVQGTKMGIVPPRPVPPGASVPLEIDWAFRIPQAGAGQRMGYSGDELFFLAYWYPQMAVYDDVGGWHPDPFLGTAEFYSGFGSYDVTVEAPEGWLVLGTGRLTNPGEVLAPDVVRRLRLAEASDSAVLVAAPDSLGPATASAPDGWLRWRFQADTARDVAFSATLESRWEAARAAVGDRDGDGTPEYARVDAVYRDQAFRWRNVVRYGQHALDFLSRYTGFPYPWPHMTSVEGAGIITGGMEYPMITLMGDYSAASDEALYWVTAHEFAHMWVPMIVATDERRFAWIDEGITTFQENQARKEFFPRAPDPDSLEALDYYRVALAGMEGEMMRRSDYHYTTPAYIVATYRKPSTILVALRGLLGEEVFLRGLRDFIHDWAYKHPQPWDLWNTFEEVSGRDLDWFWQSWYFETWTLDQAVGNVTPGPEGTTIEVLDLGTAPMPARLAITRAGGEVLRREVPVEVWLSGRRSATVTVPPGPPVVRVEIDPEGHFPDVNPENDVWTR